MLRIAQPITRKNPLATAGSTFVGATGYTVVEDSESKETACLVLGVY